jgi:hypothetical protein
MSLYFVLLACGETRQVALYDCYGSYHLARTVGAMPAIGTELHGARPCAGANPLHASSTGQAFVLVFDQIDCGQRAAFAWMGGAAAPDDDERCSPWPRITPPPVPAAWDGRVDGRRG